MRPPTRLLLGLVAPTLLACTGCGDETALERSCGGEAVPDCRPYEYAVVTAASLEPDRVMVGDPTAMLRVHVEMDLCGERAPGPHQVVVRALAQGSGGVPDAGSSERLYDLEELVDDGSTFGDETAQDGVIDVVLPSFFIGDVPTDTEMTLRFTPQLNTCEGELFELPYRTGPRFVPPGPGP